MTPRQERSDCFKGCQSRPFFSLTHAVCGVVKNVACLMDISGGIFTQLNASFTQTALSEVLFGITLRGWHCCSRTIFNKVDTMTHQTEMCLHSD